MTRRHDWHSRYVSFIEELRYVPFEWGTNDCGPSWAGRVYEVLTDEPNPAAEYIGRYKSMRGAVRVMRNAGFNDLKEAAEASFGEMQHPSRGYIGDIALIHDEDSPFGYMFGIVNGERAFFRRPDGIGTVDMSELEGIFKI